MVRRRRRGRDVSVQRAAAIGAVEGVYAAIAASFIWAFCCIGIPCPAPRPLRRPANPPFSASLMVSAAVADQSTKLNEEKTVAARAEPQTAPRQKSRCVRKTARATKPAK